MKQISLSIVIPSYNEMANLQKGTLEKIKNYLEKRDYEYEVIIVDDGSDDGSHEFVKNFVRENKNFSLLENKHLGKAGAVTAGVLKAKCDYVLFTDMDQATPIEEIEKLLPFTTLGFDIIIGSRAGIRRGAPLSRRVMAKGMMVLRSSLIGFSEIVDTQCGFKLFSRESAKKIFTKIEKIHNGFNSIKNSSVTAGFDIELLYIGSKMGYKIKEVPVEWLYVETRRVNPIRDSLDGLFELFRIKKRILNGKYA